MRIVLPILLSASALGGCSQPSAADREALSAPEGVEDPSTREPKTLHRYVLDARQSSFTAEVQVGGLLSMFGHDHVVALRDFAGEARFDPETLNGASLRLSIRAESAAEAGRDFSEEDRRKITQEIHEKALEVSKFGEILFRSTGLSARRAGKGVFQIVLRGHLTLHGVTRPVSIPARLQVDGDRLTATGKFTVRHSDYGIERLSAAGGTVKAKDDMTLSFRIVGRRE